MKLIIRNLARTTTQAEVKALFQEFGTVQSCDLVLDKITGGSKGFAFVEIPKAGEAKVAMKTLNDTTVAGSKIRVKKAVNKTVQAEETDSEEGFSPNLPDD
jgi:RNA recognition motif-containing protein